MPGVFMKDNGKKILTSACLSLHVLPLPVSSVMQQPPGVEISHPALMNWHGRFPAVLTLVYPVCLTGPRILEVFMWRTNTISLTPKELTYRNGGSSIPAGFSMGPFVHCFVHTVNTL